MEDVLGAETFKKLIEQGGLMKMGPRSEVKLLRFEGVPLPTPFITQTTMDAMKTWQARSDDVFVVSYAKAGTTWTQEVVSAICLDGDLEKVNKSHTMFRVPFLEAPLFLSTEDLKSVVEKTANFLGYSFSEDVINGITNHCTFESMKKNPMTNPDTLIQHVKMPEAEEEPSTSFMRKGKVGDWRNHFTVAQNEAMDALIQEKLAGSGLTFNY